MAGYGRTIHSQSQQFVINLLQYFQQEKQAGGTLLPVNAVQQRVADALQISVTSIHNIKSRWERNSTLSSPGKQRPRKKLKTEDLPETTKMDIRNTLYTMYSQKEHVTLSSLNVELQKKGILLSNSSINRTLHNIGFKFRKDNNRRALVERTSIADMRLTFLKRYIENSVREIIFLDETWIFAKGNPGRSWQDCNSKSVRKPEGYDGKRYIILHAGSASGFVPNASLIFASKSSKEDYHGEMNGEMFLKWVSEKLIPNLENPSLIVLDNAPYHSMLLEKIPTSSSSKDQIIQYLRRKNIPHDPQLFKMDLLKLVKDSQPVKYYQVDEMLRENGHDVLRLPPYHCEFNAIEMIWAHAKGYYNKHMGRDGYGDEKVLTMWREALAQCSPELWGKCVAHTEAIIKKWYEREKILDVTPQEIIVSLGSESSSDSDSID